MDRDFTNSNALKALRIPALVEHWFPGFRICLSRLGEWLHSRKMSGMEHRILGWNSFHRVPGLIRDGVETVPAGARLCEPEHSRSRKGFSAHDPFCILGMALVLLTGCASAPPRSSAPSGSEQVKQRLAEIINAVETKDLPRLDSYHSYGSHFTKFAGKGQRLD